MISRHATLFSKADCQSPLLISMRQRPDLVFGTWGYAVWLWLDIGNSDIAAADQRRRIGVFIDAYDGDLGEAVVLSAMMSCQSVLISEGHRRGKERLAEWASDCLAWTKANLVLTVSKQRKR